MSAPSPSNAGMTATSCCCQSCTNVDAAISAGIASALFSTLVPCPSVYSGAPMTPAWGDWWMTDYSKIVPMGAYPLDFAGNFRATISTSIVYVQFDGTQATVPATVTYTGTDIGGCASGYPVISSLSWGPYDDPSDPGFPVSGSYGGNVYGRTTLTSPGASPNTYTTCGSPNPIATGGTLTIIV
jgi:hypothetical protein